MSKVKEKVLKNPLVKEELDDTSVQYAKLTDAEAKERVDLVKKQIKELEAKANLGEDPASVFKLRGLYASLAWYRMNKLRSKYFKVVSSGASMRSASRHPDTSSLKKKGPNNVRSIKRKQAEGQKWKRIPQIMSIFSRNFKTIEEQRKAKNKNKIEKV